MICGGIEENFHKFFTWKKITVMTGSSAAHTEALQRCLAGRAAAEDGAVVGICRKIAATEPIKGTVTDLVFTSSLASADRDHRQTRSISSTSPPPTIRSPSHHLTKKKQYETFLCSIMFHIGTSKTFHPPPLSRCFQ